MHSIFSNFFSPDEIFSPKSFEYGSDNKYRYERIEINGFEDGVVFHSKVLEWFKIRKFILWKSYLVWRVLGYIRAELKILKNYMLMQIKLPKSMDLKN